MTDGTTPIPTPSNEPGHDYAPDSARTASLRTRIRSMASETAELPMVIGGEERTGESTFVQRSPHDHSLELALVHAAGSGHVRDAVASAKKAAPGWSETPWHERASIFLKAADLIAGRFRDTLNAATMLGQSKSVQQSEIDAVCELVDFLRFNAHFAQKIYAEQPFSVDGVWNRMDYRPLEGFVLAITPFNFTAIAGNLPTAPAMLGNVVLWKPSEKQALAAHYTMQVLREAGLPDGVINLLHGDGALVSDVALADEDFAGLHFTGSHDVMQSLWKKISDRIGSYRSFPRLVGETGGKDFVVAHPSARVEPLVVALGRGAFEYQGQKCSAASRAYIPRSLWPKVRDGIRDLTSGITMGNVSDDLTTFMGAVIDESAFEKHREAIERAKADGLELVCGGGTDDSDGWFVEPTVLRTEDPRYETMKRELFGPILTVYVYDDGAWDETLELVDSTSPYGLTGAVFSQDRAAAHAASRKLRQAAGNFYINDKPTGSIVGQQPFGGARRSGTNDKAGSMLNLVRWLSPRSVKETFDPSQEWRYPHQG